VAKIVKANLGQVRPAEEPWKAAVGTEMEEAWRRVVAHLPGLAPALHVLWEHVDGCGRPACEARTPQSRWGCSLAPWQPPAEVAALTAP
jgi:hypothetical protein